MFFIFILYPVMSMEMVVYWFFAQVIPRPGSRPQMVRSRTFSTVISTDMGPSQSLPCHVPGSAGIGPEGLGQGPPLAILTDRWCIPWCWRCNFQNFSPKFILYPVHHPSFAGINGGRYTLSLQNWAQSHVGGDIHVPLTGRDLLGASM